MELISQHFQGLFASFVLNFWDHSSFSDGKFSKSPQIFDNPLLCYWISCCIFSFQIVQEINRAHHPAIQTVLGVTTVVYAALTRAHVSPPPPMTTPSHALDILHVACFFSDCPRNKWDPPSCNQDCPWCYNGGVCCPQYGTCICPPGFGGEFCQYGKANHKAAITVCNQCLLLLISALCFIPCSRHIY